MNNGISRFRRVRFGAFELDLRSGELHKHGSRIRLQDQPFQILVILLEHPGDVVTREELKQKLWPADTFVDFDVGLNTAIKRLRDALGDSADEPRYVETLPRRGYRFIATVEDSGRALGHYRILEKIGAGGMGVVYRALDERLNRSVALKVLPPDSVADETARARLVREAQIASALNHPHICTIYEVGEADGQVYVAMELVEGRPLGELVQPGGLAPELVIRYGIQIADALGHAHGRGIAHRDLKSANVFIRPEGHVKVLDFGLAKRLPSSELEEVTRSRVSLAEAGAVVGTLPYMAPEVLRGEPASPSSDLWALGALLYEMATGALPFRGSTGFELSSAILREPLALPSSVPAGLRAVIERCLEKDPGHRYQRASEAEAAMQALQPASAVVRTIPLQPRRRPLARGWLAAGIVILPVVALLGLNLGGLRSRLFSSPPPRIKSIAVLPLENLTGDPAQDYFVDGMTDALTTNLAGISSLQVISRTSAMRYRGTKKSLPEIARELNVDAVVEGTVTRDGDRVRITANLIHAGTDRHLWSKTLDRDLTGIMTLQADVARAIATEIQIKLTPQEQARLAAARPVNPEAYQAYVKGLFFYDKRNPESIRKGIEHFEKAIQLDPGFAPAYAGLADAYMVLGAGLPADLEAKEAATKAKAAALKAIELDPGLAEGHVALGYVKGVYERDFPGAEKEFRLAIQLKPGLAAAHQWYANFLRVQQRPEEARREYVRALELDPVSPNINGAFADFLWYDAGQREQALEQMRKTIELDPNQFNNRLRMGHFYLVLKQYTEALAEFRKAEEIYPGSKQALSRQGYIHAVLGNRAEAERILGELKRDAEKAGQPGLVAYVYAGLRRKEETLRWLEKSCVARDREILSPIFAIRPEYEFLHSDPRFEALVRCVNQTQTID